MERMFPERHKLPLADYLLFFLHFLSVVFDVFFTDTFNKDVTYDGDEFPCRNFLRFFFFIMCLQYSI